jgi:hypothetical protein
LQISSTVTTSVLIPVTACNRARRVKESFSAFEVTISAGATSDEALAGAPTEAHASSAAGAAPRSPSGIEAMSPDSTGEGASSLEHPEKSAIARTPSAPTVASLERTEPTAPPPIQRVDMRTSIIRPHPTQAVHHADSAPNMLEPLSSCQPWVVASAVEKPLLFGRAAAVVR